jgi:hypothetical protein
MAETIAMTPNGDVQWEIHDMADGYLFLPPDACQRTVGILAAPSNSRPQEMDLIHDEDCVTVYRDDTLVVRKETGAYMATALAWFRSNLILAHAANSNPALAKIDLGDGQTKTLKTPEYFAMLFSVSGRECIQTTVMSFEGGNREHLPQEDYDRSSLRACLNNACLALINAVYGDYRSCGFRLNMDTHERNVLVGEQDIVRLDINGGLGLDF